ncbi:ATP-binding protein [Amycolatopsis jejuensis]|uniref:ATP-binding protein n=1 Tax=Amycolatopsis jejuensis TaxID=330084 RepID=UPI000523F7EC|nr:LuxR C-terminal-related transcriptional regulator [Amycolatopsis jejuensis]
MTDSGRLRGAGTLPAELTGFVGRSRELALGARRLAGDRLVTLTGTGGVGKTRLAVRLAAEAADEFPDGVHFVQLSEIREPALLPAVLAAVPTLVPPGGDGALAELPAGRRLLIVLDNCEHLLDACAHLVGQLFAAGPAVHVCATSRQPLGVAGETVLPVPPLQVPAPDDPDELVRGSDAVRLFVDRAAAVLPEFTPDAAASRTIARICRRLDGIPLALELAAVRLRTLTLDDILGMLSNRLRLLTAGSRTAPGRHQTLRSSIRWSFDLCTAAEQRAWADLSVFSGTFDLDAARAVCAPGADDVVDLLGALVDKSICVREPGTGPTRYRLPGALREFGAEQLAAAGAPDRARDRHTRWYAQVVERGHGAWMSPGQEEWVSRLAAEQTNLRAAIRRGLAEPSLVPMVSRMAVQLGDFWLARGLLADGRHWIGQLRGHPGVEDTVRIDLLCLGATLAAIQGNRAAAAADLAEAAGLTARFGDRYLAKLKYTNGFVDTFAGDAVSAAEALEWATERFGAEHDDSALIHALTLQLIAAVVAGDPAAAEQHGAACLDLADSSGDAWIRASVHWWLGLSALSAGQLPRAGEGFALSLELFLDLDVGIGVAMCVEALAWLAAAQGSADRAAYLLGGAATHWHAAGTDVTIMPCLAGKREDCVTHLRRKLGPARFDRTWRRGRSGTTREVREAGFETATARPATADPTEQLTRREKQVAALIASGLTDRQIAADLVIAPRTAEWHVERILTKLGFSSRAQVAACWAAHHGMAAIG